MSYIDDEPVCDSCDRPYPRFWPDVFVEPWPVVGGMNPDGSMPPEAADSYALCLGCLQDLVMSAQLTRKARALAIRSRDRWTASEMLLDELKSIDRASAA